MTPAQRNQLWQSRQTHEAHATENSTSPPSTIQKLITTKATTHKVPLLLTPLFLPPLNLALYYGICYPTIVLVPVMPVP